jgi:integrase
MRLPIPRTAVPSKPRGRQGERQNDRALIATLIYAGLRIGEATALRWRDIDLANGRISVSDSKTQAGIRLVTSCRPCATRTTPASA